MISNLLVLISIIILIIAFIVFVAFILQRVLVEGRISRKKVQSNQGPRYPKINNELLRQIQMIEPSIDSGIEFRPAQVTMLDGRKLDCVYMVDEQAYFDHYGMWPDKSRGIQSIRIEDVAKIEESPSRLPSEFANELYQAGESGMGYCRFTLVFRDGTE